MLPSYKFTGKERDQESGLDYFGARYYASSMGRFSSPDPSGLYYANPANPQSLNLYSYARNNPLIGTDPTGMAYCQWDDGSHDDSANTGVEGAVNSGSECTGAGGTWSHNDGLNDDGSQMGSELPVSFTNTATLVTSTNSISVSTSGPDYDPQDVSTAQLLDYLAQDTASFPNICEANFSLRAPVPYVPALKAGVSVDLDGNVSASARLKQGGAKGGPSASVNGRANLNSAATSQQVNIPIPDTPFDATYSVNPFSGRKSFGLSGDDKAVSLSGNASFGYMGDPNCQKR